MMRGKMAAIEFDNVSKIFAGSAAPAVNNVTAEIEKGEFVTILGSSGCGKTTLLKMTNKLYEPSGGRILIDGKNASHLDPITLRRSMGYVIQQVGLFPHMTVAKNIAQGPELSGWKKEKTDERILQLLEMVGLDPDEFAARYPGQLSGGQQQRVGLARALATDPDILLMDEPFGAIDAITRLTLQNELMRLQSERPRTILFVTHDINEAFKLGDRTMVMNEGRLLQFDEPSVIADKPSDEFVRMLVDSARNQERFWSEYR